MNPLKFLFAFNYYFYVNVLRERDVPVFYSAANIALSTVLCSIAFDDLLIFLGFPSIIYSKPEHLKYIFGVGLILFFILYRYFNNNLVLASLLKDYQEIDKRRRMIFNIICTVYLIGSAVLFGYMGSLTGPRFVE